MTKKGGTNVSPEKRQSDKKKNAESSPPTKNALRAG